MRAEEFKRDRLEARGFGEGLLGYGRPEPTAAYTVCVFGGDVGGVDEDFEAETLEEARELAARFHPAGARSTEIRDADTGVTVEWVPA